MTRTSNPKVSIVAVNIAGGALVLISASKCCRYVEISECAPKGTSFTGGNFAPQGLVYYLPDDSYVQGYPLLPGATLPLGDNNWARDRSYGFNPGTDPATGNAVTDPAGNAITPTPYVKLVSATSTATQVQIKEWS